MIHQTQESAFTPDEIRAAVEMHKHGIVDKNIAAQLGRTREQVAVILSLGGVKRARPAPVAPRIDRPCVSYEAFKRDSAAASAQLLAAIQRANLCP